MKIVKNTIDEKICNIEGKIENGSFLYNTDIEKLMIMVDGEWVEFDPDFPQLVSTGNPGQYVTKDGETLISMDRFCDLLDLHQDKYIDYNAFWDMFIRDLFEIHK